MSQDTPDIASFIRKSLGIENDGARYDNSTLEEVGYDSLDGELLINRLEKTFGIDLSSYESSILVTKTTVIQLIGMAEEAQREKAALEKAAARFVSPRPGKGKGA